MTCAVGAAALRCARKGWPVLPLRGKVPTLRHGLKDASIDPAQVAAWWDRDPEANLGIATGVQAGIWVLDLDLHDPAKNGLESVQALEAEHEPLPDTLSVRTGSGGLHLYWSMPGGQVVRNRTEIRPGIDSRGEGGYVVAPPSIHPDTRELYRVAQGGRHQIAEAPEWLVSLVAPVVRQVRAAPRARVGVRLRPGEYDREAARRLRCDPGTRERAAIALEGKIVGSGENQSAKGIMCPQCSRPSVWWPINPKFPGGSARCAHLNSCGWWGPLAALLRG